LQSPDSSSGFNILLQIKANAHAFRKYSNFIISESKQEIIDHIILKCTLPVIKKASIIRKELQIP